MRIGFLINDLQNGYQRLIWSGIRKEAEAMGLQILSIPGRWLHSDLKEDRAHNLLYDFLSTNLLDGFIVTATTFGGGNSTQSQLHDFFSQYGHMPYVSIGVKMQSEPTVFVDNTTGLRDLVTHFVEHHNYRDIGFIRGPHKNSEAEERYNTYKGVMETHGLSINPDWIQTGDFEEASGYRGMKNIWQASNKPRAILAANDNMLLGAYEYLEAQGVKSPSEVALGGFDDIQASRFNPVPLSTVRQPIVEQAQASVRLIHEYVSSKKPPKDITLNTHGVFRNSCGCSSKNIQFAGFSMASSDLELKPGSITEQIEDLLVRETDKDLKELATKDDIQKVWDMLQRFIDNSGTPEERDTLGEEYIQMLESILEKEQGRLKAIHTWTGIFSAMARIMKSRLEPDLVLPVCSLIQQSYILISEKIDQIQGYRSYQQSVEVTNIQSSLQNIMEAYDIEEFISRLASELENLKFETFYLVLFDGELKDVDEYHEKLPERSYIRLQLTEGKVTIPEYKTFRTETLLPQDVLTSEKTNNLVVQMIVFDNKPAGLMITDSANKSADIFESLRSQISSSIRAGNLINYMISTQEHLKKRNQEIEDVVIPMLDSINEVNRITDSNMKSMGMTVDQIEETRVTFTKTTESVETIAENTRYMMDLIKMIDDISERINILSINASIESARAGMHGKGFGVISGEVRKLADSTAQNASQTSETLKKVVDSIAISRESSKKSMDAYDVIQKDIHELADSLNHIENQMARLTEASRQIMDIIKK